MDYQLLIDISNPGFDPDQDLTNLVVQPVVTSVNRALKLFICSPHYKFNLFSCKG